MRDPESLKRAKKKYYEKNMAIVEKYKTMTPEEKIVENLKIIISNLFDEHKKKEE